MSSCTMQFGFLYLRYVVNPRSTWDWLQYYIKDSEVCLRHWLAATTASDPAGLRNCLES